MQKLEVHSHARPTLWHGRLTIGGFVLKLSLNRAPQQPPDLLTNRLAILRQERRLNRQELASLLSIAPSTLAALEQGSYQPSLSLALRLSAFFDLPVEAIFSPTARRFSE